MNTPEEMLKAKVDFAKGRLNCVNNLEQSDMPTPISKKTTTSATLLAGREVYKDNLSNLIYRMNKDLERSKRQDTKAIKGLIAKMSKPEVEEELELQA